MTVTSLHRAFETLPDPRIRRNRKHDLSDIIILSILAVISGADSWDSIEMFGKIHYEFLKRYLRLPSGIPSHDTINRVFSMLNPVRFEELFIAWAQSLKDNKTSETEHDVSKTVIAVDGKTSRGSKDSYHKKSPLHVVNAWCVSNGICLGQNKADDKSNEITAIPELLKLLDINGSIITIDAMGTQRAIAEQIVDAQADYILSVKGNQKTLAEQVKVLTESTREVRIDETVEKNRGRIETRRCQVFVKDFRVDEDNNWKGLKSIIKITSLREYKGKKSREIRFYISSLNSDEDFNKHIRSHWAVENSLHWTLDMTFREDEQRKRARHAAQNFALVEKIALNIIKKDSGKGSIKSKRLKAAWDTKFLVNLLTI